MMSGPLASFSAQERLRRRFAVWGLAIFGSISSTGAVMLDHTSVWAADDPSSGSATSGPLAPPNSKNSNQENPRQKNQAENSSGPTPLNREQLLALLKANQTTEAAQRVDAALAAEPSAANYYLSYLLASHLGRTDATAAEERLKAILSALEDRLGDSASAQTVSCYAMSAHSLAPLLDARGQTEQALAMLDEAATKMSKVRAAVSVGLLAERCRILIKLDRADEAKRLMDKCVEDAFRRSDQSPTLSNRMAVPAVISAYARLFHDRYSESLKKYRQKAESVSLAKLDQEDAGPDDYLVYQSLQIATAVELGESDPKAAQVLLDDLHERQVQFKGNLSDDDRKRLLPFEQTLEAARARNATKLLQHELIGQPATEIDIGAVVNMKPVQWAELKGKVVLLNHWAVWCGPCIDTFARLRQLHQEYADRGLVIIGVTRWYGYTWNAESKHPLPKDGASLAEELAMLEEFRRHHELPYGFIVLPRPSIYSQKFGVTGIPHAVLVDQNGVIQLIRVGAADKNFSDIEAKIKELLDRAD